MRSWRPSCPRTAALNPQLRVTCKAILSWGQILAGGFCFPGSQGEVWGEGSLGSGRVQDMWGGFKGQLSRNGPCSDIPRLFLTGAPAGTISWPSMWNTGLPGGPPPSLRDSGRPFATGTSCQYWRPSLMGRTLDSHCRGLRGR